MRSVGTKSGGLTEGGDEEGGGEGGGRRRVRVEHTASVPASTLDHFSSAWLANVSGLAWKMFTGERRLRANAYASLSSSLSLFLSPFHPPSDGLIGRRETRKVRERKVQNCDRSSWSTRLLLLLLLRKCVDIPTVMSYVKLSPTFSALLVFLTYLRTYFEGCGYGRRRRGRRTRFYRSCDDRIHGIRQRDDRTSLACQIIPSL